MGVGPLFFGLLNPWLPAHNGSWWSGWMPESFPQAIRQVAEPIAKALGVEILEVHCLGKPDQPLVRFILDKENGVGIEDCEQFHQSLRRTWEVTCPTGSNCRFEVSSPGLDRPLKEPRDYQRVIGNLIRVTLRNPIAKQMVLIGHLRAVTDQGLLIEQKARGKKAQDRTVAWDDIVKARLEIEF